MGPSSGRSTGKKGHAPSVHESDARGGGGRFLSRIIASTMTRGGNRNPPPGPIKDITARRRGGTMAAAPSPFRSKTHCAPKACQHRIRDGNTLTVPYVRFCKRRRALTFGQVDISRDQAQLLPTQDDKVHTPEGCTSSLSQMTTQVNKPRMTCKTQFSPPQAGSRIESSLRQWRPGIVKPDRNGVLHSRLWWRTAKWCRRLPETFLFPYNEDTRKYRRAPYHVPKVDKEEEKRLGCSSIPSL